MEFERAESDLGSYDNLIVIRASDFPVIFSYKNKKTAANSPVTESISDLCND